MGLHTHFEISEKIIGFQSSTKKTKSGIKEIESKIVFSDFFENELPYPYNNYPFFEHWMSLSGRSNYL